MRENRVSCETSFNIQAFAPSYQALGHEMNELQHSIQYSNNLHMYDKRLESLYRQVLLTSAPGKPSQEFLRNLWVFYLYTISVLFIGLFHKLALYYEDLSDFHFIYQLVVTLLFTVTGLLLRAHSLRHFDEKVMQRYFVFSFFLVNSLVFTDERVLTKSAPDFNIPASFIIVGFLFVLKMFFFSRFFELCVISITSLLLFGILKIALNGVLGLFEYLLLIITVVILNFEAHQTEFRAKQLFARKQEEEKHMQDESDQHEPVQSVKVELEILITKLNTVLGIIKDTSRVIMLEIVKNNLKVAKDHLRAIKESIVRGVNSEAIIMNSLDSDFLVKLCENPSKRSTEYSHKMTMVRETQSRHDLLHYSLGELWNFDMFELANTTGHSVLVVGKHFLIEKWPIALELGISPQTIHNYLSELENSYYNNPYHSATHAADVMNSMAFFLLKGELFNALYFLDVLSLTIATLGHDAAHPAFTNRYLIESKDDYAYEYNDNSVLENMHCAKTFMCMLRPGCDILETLNKQDWQIARRTIIYMILKTDMAKHFQFLAKFKLLSNNLQISDFKDKLLVLAMGLKCADMGHSAKTHDLHMSWTAKIMEEFESQGELEKQKNIEPTVFFDRDPIAVAKNQAVFLSELCLPLFESWSEYLRSDTVKTTCLDQVKKNIEIWENKAHSSFLSVKLS